jgi:hypothetical protein
MLLIYFVLIMAGKAVIFGAARRVALAAFAIGIAMIHREFMVEGRSSPGGSGMALRTLPIKMIGRLLSAVAGFAVCRSRSPMVELRA